MSTGHASIERLWRERPRSRFLRGSMLTFGLLLLICWLYVGAHPGDLLSPESTASIAKFFTEDIKPRSLRGEPWSWEGVGAWVAGEMDARGWSAVAATLGVSVVAIVLAALSSLLLSLLAARTFATPEPFLPSGRPPTRTARWWWGLLRGCTRALFVLMRSLPEYILAFLLLTIVGRSAWPAVLALAIHNGGILGRLNAEVIENLPKRTLETMRAAGAGRLQMAMYGVLPAALPRFLLYFFYRWETCVREATVLSMLGMVGIGYWIVEADAHDREDLLFLYVLLASALVLIGDLVSAIARRIVRHA